MSALRKTLLATSVAIVAGVAVYEARHTFRLREENQALLRQIQWVEQERDAALQQAAMLRDGNERANRNRDELLKLRGEVNTLRRQRDELRQPAAGRNASPSVPPEEAPADANWIQQMLSSPPKDQGAAAGTLRGKLLRRELTNISPSELALRDALLQRQLNQNLERSPVEFADFQTAFIQSALAMADGARVQQMHDLIQETYVQAVANGLDILSKPTTDTEAWVQRRFQLDRQATAQLRQLLSPEEQALFDRAFLGVMGIDLGGVGVDQSNYPKGFLAPQ